MLYIYYIGTTKRIIIETLRVYPSYHPVIGYCDKYNEGIKYLHMLQELNPELEIKMRKFNYCRSSEQLENPSYKIALKLGLISISKKWTSKKGTKMVIFSDGKEMPEHCMVGTLYHGVLLPLKDLIGAENDRTYCYDDVEFYHEW